MRSGCHKRIIAAFILALFIVAALAGCGRTSNDPKGTSGQNLTGGENNPNRPTEGVPETYGYSLLVRFCSEFVLYLSDNGEVFSFEATNPEAETIKDHTNIVDEDVFNAVMDILQVSIDDFHLDPSKEKVEITMIEANVGEDQDLYDIVRRAWDAVNEVFQRYQAEPDVLVQLPRGLEWDPEHPGEASDPGPDESETNPYEAHPNFDLESGEWVCSNAEEIESVIEFLLDESEEKDHGPVRIVVAEDLALPTGSPVLWENVELEMNGHAVTLTGKVDLNESDPAEYASRVTIMHASRVDLTNVSVDLNEAKNIQPDTTPREGMSAKESEFFPQRGVAELVRIVGTPAENVAFPAAAEMNPIMDEWSHSMFEPIFSCSTVDDVCTLAVLGPVDTYESRQQKEITVLQSIFSSGEYHQSVIDREVNIYTNVVMDIGTATLPNMNYDHISIGKGGHLKLTGTLVITGGTLDIDTKEWNGLDLTGLTLVKGHPSPDMIHIHCDPSIGMNVAACHCTAASGEIHFSADQNGMSITIW